MPVECLVPWEDHEKCQHSQYSLEHCIYDGPVSIYLKKFKLSSLLFAWKYIEQHAAKRVSEIQGQNTRGLVCINVGA